jgi:uncharacterized FlaG/YvyC family protein
MDLQILYDLLKEVREDQKKHSDELMHQSGTLMVIKRDVEINTADLTEHKEGVAQAKEQNRLVREELYLIKGQIEKEIDKLKEPSKFKEWLYSKYMKYITVVSITLGVVGGVAKILGYI